MVKVSIIIPIFNGSEYIAECIKGIQKQTLQDIEILCVDDGSADNSLCILRQMQKNDNRIHIFEQENQGAGSARNLALENAVGEFVCFLDIDDYFLADNALEELYYNAVNRNVLVCGGQFYTDFGNEIKRVPVYRDLWDDTQRGRMLEYADYQQDFYFSNYLYSRQMLQKHGIVFPVYRLFEDPPFCVKALSVAERFYVTDIPFYCYRVGYKERIYDEQMACDQIKGMVDNLYFSRQKRFKRLHQITYYRVINSCRRELKTYCKEKNGKLAALLKEAEKAVCWEWLEEKCSIRERTFRMFWNVPDNGEDWIIPNDELGQGGKIVLYGAGEVGRSYCRQIRKDGQFSLCMWVDGNYSRIKEIDGIEIVSPKNVWGISFDYIVIAVANMMTALEIMDVLSTIGVEPEKVVWNIGR